MQRYGGACLFVTQEGLFAHKIHRGAIFVGEKEMKNFLDTLNSSILSTDNKNQSLMYS